MYNLTTAGLQMYNCIFRSSSKNERTLDLKYHFFLGKSCGAVGELYPSPWVGRARYVGYAEFNLMLEQYCFVQCVSEITLKTAVRRKKYAFWLLFK